jgi:hypothetical protein
MPNVIWIEEWLRRKDQRQRIGGGRRWYPSRWNEEKGDWEWEPVDAAPCTDIALARMPGKPRSAV